MKSIRSIGCALGFTVILAGCTAPAPGTPLSDDVDIGVGQCPVVARTGDGDIWLAWEGSSWEGSSDEQGIRLRRFAADGEPLGPSQRVDAPTPGRLSCPHIAVNDAGRAAVLWRFTGTETIPVPGLGQPPSRRQPKLLLQRFTADGAADGDPIAVVDRINRNYTDYDPVAGDLAMGADGSMLVAWRETITVLSPVPLPTIPVPAQVRVRTLTGYHQVFGADGLPRTEPITSGTAVIPQTLGLWPNLQLRFDGLFAVHAGIADSGDYVLGFRGNTDAFWSQRFDSLGQAHTLLRSRLDPVDPAATQGDADLSVAADGRFDVVVVESVDSSGDTVRGYAFDADGAPRAQGFVTETTTDGRARSLLRLSRYGQGQRVVAWRSGILSGTLSTSPIIRAQYFDAGGQPETAAFQVNEDELPRLHTGQQSFSMDAAVDAAGSLAVVWTHGDEIRGRVFAGPPELTPGDQ